MPIALRFLDPAEMLALSGAWLGPQRADLEKIPELGPLLPRLSDAHESLSRSQSAAPASSDRLKQITSAARETDDRHDHAVRALFFALSAAIEHLLSHESPDIDMVTRIEVLRDLVLPEGLATTQATYEAEAGMASKAAEAVASDREAQRLLEKLHVLPRVTGLELLATWSDLGTRLGALDLERSALVGESGPAPHSAAKARNGWLSIVATMLSVADHARAREQALALVRAPLEKACAEGARRQADARKKGLPAGSSLEPGALVLIPRPLLRGRGAAEKGCQALLPHGSSPPLCGAAAAERGPGGEDQRCELAAVNSPSASCPSGAPRCVVP